MKALHQRLNLYTNGNETYTFVPAEPVGARSLTIYRNSGDIVLNAPNTPLPVTAERSGKTIYGIYGLVSLALSEYIIVITGRELRGRLMAQNIYRATDYEILPLNPDISVSSPPHPVEGHLLALVKSHLSSGNFLFSYAWDLTRRLQAQWASLKEDGDKPLWEVADDRFFWNKFLQSRLIDVTVGNPDQNLSPYILPVLYGTFDIRPERINGHHVRLCLISRRSRYRAGTRYFRRGIDEDGHVANFNETEQILLVGPDDNSVQLSFVQIRGSVPVFWAEINTLRYKPDVQIMELQESVDATQKHFQDLVATYGESSLVNLVDQKGHELPVKEAYERNVRDANFPKVKYEYFDFHNECKHMRWDRIQGLLDRLDEDLTRYGYFHLDASKPEPAKVQVGVIRTNCMDNLDRTNVGQSAIAKRVLTRQLQALGILHDTDTIDRYEDFMKDFREMWTDHANLISMAYSGTGALKTDFTKTGRRTRQGMFEDLSNSVMRYLKNNFFDGARQDAYDLMTGAFVPRKGWVPSTFVYDSRPLVIRAVPYASGFSLFMIFAGMTLPRTSDYSLFYYFLLWFTVFTLSIVFIFAHGIEYVNWPRLVSLAHIINYDGPGFRSGQRGKGFGIPALDLRSLKSTAPVHRGKLPGHRRIKSRMEEIEMGTKRVD
ncbi:SacI homology domain-containing protein [Fomitopsis betulina]|nr:SacI homology domain-containing protein [Fomitopsis betulina]